MGNWLEYVLQNRLGNLPQQQQQQPQQNPLANLPGAVGIGARAGLIGQPSPHATQPPPGSVRAAQAAQAAQAIGRQIAASAPRPVTPPPNPALAQMMATPGPASVLPQIPYGPGIVGRAQQAQRAQAIGQILNPGQAQRPSDLDRLVRAGYTYPQAQQIASANAGDPQAITDAISYKQQQNRQNQTRQAVEAAGSPGMLGGDVASTLAGPVAQTVGQVAAKGANLLDKPRQWNVEGRGQIIFQTAAWELAQNPADAERMGLIAKGSAATMSDADFKNLKLDAFTRGNGTPFGSLAYPFNIGDPKKRDEVLRGVVNAYLYGYTATGGEITPSGLSGGPTRVQVPVAHFDPGGRAVWEYVQGTQSAIQRGVNDMVFDPLNVGLGPVDEAGKALAQAGEEAATREGAGTLQRVAGRVGQGIGVAAQAPNAALGALPHLLIEGPLGALGQAMETIPVLGKLFKETVDSAARAARNETSDAIRLREGMADTPAGVSQTTGVPEPQPQGPALAGGRGEPTQPQPGASPAARLTYGEVPPVFDPESGQWVQPGPRQYGPSAYGPNTADVGLRDYPELHGPPVPYEPIRSLPPGEIPPPGTPRATTLPSGPELTVTPEGEVLGGKPLPEVPTRNPKTNGGRYTYVGETETYRVTAIGDGRGRIEERISPPGKRDRWNLIGERPTVDAAVGDAKTLARGGALPEAAPRTVATPETATAPAKAAAAGVAPTAEPMVTKGEPFFQPREPRPGANRLIERAQALAERTPELAPARDRFVAEATPDAGRQAARQRIEDVDYGAQTPAAKRTIRLEQTTDNIEAVVEKDLPAFQRNFPDAPVDPASLMTEKRYETAGAKRDFKTENDRWLAQAYVFEGRDNALAVLEQKPGVTPDVVARLRAARAAIDGDLLPGTRWSEVPRPTSEGGTIPPTQMGSGPVPYTLQQALQPRETRAPFPESGPVRNPNPNLGTEAIPHLPDRVQRVLDAQFAGAYDPARAGMTTDQVYQSVKQEVASDRATYRNLADQGYSPENYRGEGKPKNATTPTRVKVQVGEEPVGKTGRTRPVYEWRAAATAAGDPNEAMAALRAKYRRFGDIANDDVATLARERTAWERMVDLNPKTAKRPHLLVDLADALVNRLPRNLILADPLTSWDYSMRNVAGNYALSGIKGATPDIREVWRAGSAPHESVAADLEEELFGPKARGVPAEMTGGGSRLDAGGPGRDTPARELGQKLHIDVAAKGFDLKKGFDHKLESGHKLSTYATLLHGTVAEAIDPFAAQMGTYAARRGIGVTEAEVADRLWAMRGAAGGFNQHEVYDAFLRMGGDAGADEATSRKFAQTAAREWNARAIEARAKAIAETNRIFPARRLTNLDRYAGYLTLFHFWPTRSAKFLAEEMLRDPRLIHWWLQAHKGLDRMAQEGNYPASVKGLMWIANSPFGWALYANPASLFLVTAFEQQQAQYGDPQGMTRIGHYVQAIKDKTGLSPTPWLDALLNVTGVYGDSFLPNPLPSGTIQLAGSAIDAILTHGGHHPGDPVYQNAWSYLRGAASGIIPGTTKVPYANQADKRLDPTANEVLRQNPELLAKLEDPATAADGEAELAAIMNEDNDDPRLAAAERVVADNGLFTQIATNLSPLPIKGKDPTREDLLDKAKVARGVPFDQRTPAQQAIVDARNATTQTPEGLALSAGQDQYNALGTQRQKDLAKYWQVIAYGALGTDIPAMSSIKIGTTFIPAGKLVGMTDAERKVLADQYVRTQGGTDELKAYRDERDRWMTANPSGAGDFKQYQNAVYGYKGGGPAAVSAFRRDLVRTDKNFARAVEDQKQRIGSADAAVVTKELDNWTTGMAGYEAATGIKGSIYDPQPIATGGGWKPMAADDKILQGGAGGFGGGKGSSRLDALVKNLAAYQDASDKMFAATGLRPEQVNDPYSQRVLQAQGLYPNVPQDVQLYWAWVQHQPQGADTSPQTYDTYLDTLKSQQAA